MFEKSLKEKFERIFDLKKVTFDRPGDSQEQECAFIEVTTARCTVRDGQQIAKVTGTLHVFANSDKLPYGYFEKCIAQADPDDVKDLFFYDFEGNKGTFRNIAERSMGFLYLFDSQFDPNIGTLNQINLSFAES